MKFTIMVPVEIEIYNKDVKPREIAADLKYQGPYPRVSGADYEWRARFDKILEKDLRRSFNGEANRG